MIEIKDFFSHKIHSKGDDWPDKLVELAFLFSEFDNQPFDRQLIEERLSSISPRSSYVARDPSKFRDEYSAYPAYFGLYHLKPSEQGWIVKLSETAKHLLVREEPDVASFLRLQLTLFQYPNGMGAAYYPKTNNLRIQANTYNRTIAFIRNQAHLSPLRLIAILLLADSHIRRVPLIEASVSYDEIFALANQSEINKSALPSLEKASNLLLEARKGKINPPSKYESRFHLLKHLDLFAIGRTSLRLRDVANEVDRTDLESKLRAIAEVDNEFRGFDKLSNAQELEDAIKSGAWADYFDGLKSIEHSKVQILTADLIPPLDDFPANETILLSVEPSVYPLRVREQYVPIPDRPSRQRELADPEVTKILRQRRNLAHKVLLDKMDSLLRQLGANPMESQFIDLYAKIPNDGSFLFEVKSGGSNLLAQVRKGLSQLYEYRFRYRDKLDEPVTLCMVFPYAPTHIPWIVEYLCIDRKICLCWFNQEGKLEYPPQCSKQMKYLFAASNQP